MSKPKIKMSEATSVHNVVKSSRLNLVQNYFHTLSNEGFYSQLLILCLLISNCKQKSYFLGTISQIALGKGCSTTLITINYSF